MPIRIPNQIDPTPEERACIRRSEISLLAEVGNFLTGLLDDDITASRMALGVMDGYFRSGGTAPPRRMLAHLLQELGKEQS
jgi:hypothetical protein